MSNYFAGNAQQIPTGVERSLWTVENENRKLANRTRNWKPDVFGTEPAEPDTKPEPAERELAKMKVLDNPQKSKKVKQSIQNQKITSPHHPKSKNTFAPPAEKRGGDPGARMGPNPLCFREFL